MKALLALLALTLAGALAWQWRDWPSPAPEPNSADAKAPKTEVPPQPAVNPLDMLTPLGEKDEYLIVTERPLFLSDRRPPAEKPEEVAEAEPEVASDLARLDLNAVLITPSDSSAWVWDPAKRSPMA